MKGSRNIWIVLLLLAAADIVLWRQIGLGNGTRPGYYFFSVGQGDSELVVAPGGAKILIDGGPNASVVSALEKTMPPGDRYLDLVVSSHPQLDHFAGIVNVIENYRIGAFLWNGRSDSPNVAEWRDLVAHIAEKRIAMIPVGRGDIMRAGDSVLHVISPDVFIAQSAELNDTGLVMRVEMPGAAALFAADIGSNIESYLVRRDAAALRTDVLKVAHHGSKYASSADFLRAVSPRAVVIEVGAHNTYGHPSGEALQRIASSTDAAVFRTDQDGTVAIVADGGIYKAITGL